MAEIKKISGPVVTGSGMRGVKMFDLVRVGEMGIIGEVIQLREDQGVVQVYEDTAGLQAGEKIDTTGMPLSIELGPGLLGSILDGIGRPLPEIAKQSGDFIARGIDVPTLDRSKEYNFKATAKKGDEVKPGQNLGYVQETELIAHQIMVPPKVSGKLLEINGGKHKLDDVVAKIDTGNGVEEITLVQRWPVRFPRPLAEKLDPTEPLISGQRVFDTFFPLVKGGAAAIPGPFGAGKTVSQHQLAKWVDADIVVYIGCGERGNEMTEVLTEFPELLDPKTGKPLMERTVLIANTSNMPVAAREASIYTGITIAEYFRDMGYNVSMMADSTSRWAEALREISGRLAEMPADQGYPAYLGAKLAQFYERAGRVRCLGGGNREGSVTLVGAVSPPGGDFSDPVTASTLGIVQVFWGLDKKLAQRKHFPSVNWSISYSNYDRVLEEFYEAYDPDFMRLKTRIKEIL